MGSGVPTSVSVVAEFRATATAFPFGEALQSHPDIEVEVELERVVPTDHGPMPFVWARGTDRATIEAAFRDVDGISGVEIVERLDSADLVRLEWDETVYTIVKSIEHADSTLLSARGTSDGWVITLRAPDRPSLEPFVEDCEAHGVHLELRRVHHLTEEVAPERYGLTEGQLEALVTAYDLGYFEEPRRSSLEEVGTELGVSRQAAGARLRRAIQNLIQAAVIENP